MTPQELREIADEMEKLEVEKFELSYYHEIEITHKGGTTPMIDREFIPNSPTRQLFEKLENLLYKKGH